MKNNDNNFHSQVNALSLAQYEEAMGEYQIVKKPAHSLQQFSDEFVRTALDFDIYVSVGPNLQILSLDARDSNGILRMISALEDVYEELLLYGDDVDLILPYILLIEDYMKVLKSKIASKRRQLN